jgi:transcription termination factor NusB
MNTLTSVANATTDLLLLGAWAIALESIEGESIPVYYFARDDRVFKAFVDRVNTHQATIRRALSRRLKWQFRVLQNVLEGRNTTYRRKVEILTEELDDGDGV